MANFVTSMKKVEIDELLSFRKRNRNARARRNMLDASPNTAHHQIRCDPLTTELMKHPDGIYSQQALQHDYLCTIHLKQPQHDLQRGHHLPMTTLTAGGSTTEEENKAHLYGSPSTGMPADCHGIHPIMTKRGDQLYELPRFPYPDMCPQNVRVQSVESISCLGGQGDLPPCEGVELKTS